MSQDDSLATRLPITVVNVMNGDDQQSFRTTRVMGAGRNISNRSSNANNLNNNTAVANLSVNNNNSNANHANNSNDSRPFPLWRRLYHRARAFAYGTNGTWIVRGLSICLGMMLMGSIGSYTLHQMMSPQIESLLLQRKSLQDQLAAMEIRFNNMTRIAESRLEMIHMLEKELEKQHLAAIEAQKPKLIDQIASNQARNGTLDREYGFLLPTVTYIWILGGIILLMVFVRVYRIVQHERKINLNESMQRISTHGSTVNSRS